jgi:hypothetical protein
MEESPANIAALSPQGAGAHCTFEWVLRALKRVATSDARILQHIWEHQSEPKKIDLTALKEKFNAQTDGVVDAPRISRIRTRVLEICDEASSADCPLIMQLDRRSNQPKFLPREYPVQVLPITALASLVDRTTGVLLPHAEVIVYSVHANDHPAGLPQSILEALRNGVTYRYFIPVKFCQNIIDHLMNFLNAVPANELRSVIPLLSKHLEINVIAEEFPISLDIYNANKPMVTVIFVRCRNPRVMVEYDKGETAYRRADQLLSYWKPQARSKPPNRQSPVVLPAQGVEIPSQTLQTLRDECLSALLNKGIVYKEAAEIIDGFFPRLNMPV